MDRAVMTQEQVISGLVHAVLRYENGLALMEQQSAHELEALRQENESLRQENESLRARLEQVPA